MSSGSTRHDDAVVDDARGLLDAGHPGVLTYGLDGERRGVEVFVATYAPRPRMLVFGATDHAAAVAATGSFLGYHVTVGDARPVFATASRSPAAAEVVVDRQGHGAQPLRLVEGPIQGGPAHGAADVHGS